MITRYSILSVLLRPEIQEKISVGLLFFDENEIYFSYSPKKLSAIKSLLPRSSFKLVSDTLETIIRKIDPDIDETRGKGSFFIAKSKFLPQEFSVSYLDYVSRYSNNSIAFTSPKDITLKACDDNFIRLFQKYIDADTHSKSMVLRTKPFDVIRKQYAEKIEEYFDIQAEVTPDQIPNLITPVRVDFSGRNAIDVYGQTIDMEAGIQTVINHINAFAQLKMAYLENRIEVKDFVIAQEPDKNTFPKQHGVWQQLRSSSSLNYLDLSESEKLIEYAETHGVVPLSSL